MEVDLASAITLLLGGGGTGAAGLLGLQKLGLLKNSGNGKEMTKITMTQESIVRTLEPLPGILSHMREQLVVISEKQNAVSDIPVIDQKINGIQQALERIEDDIKDIRLRGRAVRSNQG